MTRSIHCRTDDTGGLWFNNNELTGCRQLRRAVDNTCRGVEGGDRERV